MIKKHNRNRVSILQSGCYDNITVKRERQHIWLSGGIGGFYVSKEVYAEFLQCAFMMLPVKDRKNLIKQLTK